MNIFVARKSGNDFYNKPDGALEQESGTLYLPDNTENISYTAAIFVKIIKAGKYIGTEFSSRYYNLAGGALNFYITLKLQGNQSRYEERFNFFRSTMMDRSLFISKNLFEAGLLPKEIIEKINLAVSEISRIASLKTGDLIVLEITDQIPVNKNDSVTFNWQDIQFPSLRID